VFVGLLIAESEAMPRFSSRVIVALMLACPAAFAGEERARYVEATPRPHSFGESALYVGAIYVGSLGGYLLLSREEVIPNATLQNYFSNFGSMTFFDQDSPGSNWGIHFLTGMLLYQFYRARSYSKVDAFFMGLISECLFQFTVETLIQPTALENVSNTTIVGSILGRSMELASLPLLNSDFFLFRALGHVINLPVLLGLYEGKVRAVPIVGDGRAGVSLVLRL
jgi:hypothetical protein